MARLDHWSKRARRFCARACESQWPAVTSDGTLVGTIDYRTVLEEFASTEVTPEPVDALGGVLDLVQLYWVAMANLLSMFTRRVDEQPVSPEGGA